MNNLCKGTPGYRETIKAAQAALDLASNAVTMTEQSMSPNDKLQTQTLPAATGSDHSTGVNLVVGNGEESSNHSSSHCGKYNLNFTNQN